MLRNELALIFMFPSSTVVYLSNLLNLHILGVVYDWKCIFPPLGSIFRIYGLGFMGLWLFLNDVKECDSLNFPVPQSDHRLFSSPIICIYLTELINLLIYLFNY